MSNDIAIGTVGLPNVGGVSSKPPHLIDLSEGKNKNYFLSLDKPELLVGFIQVKGFFMNSSETEELQKDLKINIAQTPKEKIVEILFPTHRILSIKNLAFKAK